MLSSLQVNTYVTVSLTQQNHGFIGNLCLGELKGIGTKMKMAFEQCQCQACCSRDSYTLGYEKVLWNSLPSYTDAILILPYVQELPHLSFHLLSTCLLVDLSHYLCWTPTLHCHPLPSPLSCLLAELFLPLAVRLSHIPCYPNLLTPKLTQGWSSLGCEDAPQSSPPH